MQVRFWGTRGSVPTPGPHTARYGGNTSCVEVVADDGTHIILDCGTGARALGQQLLQSHRGGPLRLHLFIGHIHWDHIQGFPFFVPAFLPDTELHIYAPRGFQRNLEESLAGQMQHAYFPLKLRELRSRIEFTQLEEGFFRLGDVLVETQHLNHTAPTIAYRITADGATLAYSTDHEPFWKPGGLSFRHPGDQRHLAFLQDADLVIHDAQYTEAEYPEKLGWGHSTIEYATDVAAAAGVRQLALFHHDPTRDDVAIDRLQGLAQARASAYGVALEVVAAAEGLTIDLGNGDPLRERGEAPAVVHGAERARQVEFPAMAPRPIAGRSVLVVGCDEEQATAMEQEMWEDHLVLVRVPDVAEAVAQVGQLAPDLVILDSGHQTARRVTATLRERLERPTLPIIVLVDADDDRDLTSAELDAATDYLAKPFSPPMLRSRVRAWLARMAGPASVSARGRRAGPRSADEAPASREELRDALGGVKLFGTLSPDELELLSARATEHWFEPSQVMIYQGVRADDLFVILAGRARVVERPEDPTSTELVLGELGTGDVVGELAVLTGMPRSATVVAIDRVRTVRIPGAEFLRLLHSAPSLSGSLALILARRIYETDHRMTRFAPDPLTGLLSRRSFEEQYPRIAALARRRGTGVLLLLVDIVSLKRVNDAYGYAAGDDVVRAVAGTLLDYARRTDLLSRWGGDEFALIPVDANPAAVESILHRLDQGLAEARRRLGLPAPIHVAYGVAAAMEPPDDVAELVRRADEDMQRRKSAELQARHPEARAG